MRKSETAARKARSSRNRHNGKINSYKGWILNHANAQESEASDGTKYKVLVTRKPMPMSPYANIGDEPDMLVKTQIVRA